MVRFRFGKNWQRYSRHVDDQRVSDAQASLVEWLGPLQGRMFCDVGSGSGIFSLAAARAGASQILSFDFDPDSVAATKTMKERFFVPGPEWTVTSGDILDEAWLSSQGLWDVVYAWGVLHHTGDLSQAMTNTASLVKPGGLLWVAIYNDQGPISGLWSRVKRMYNGGGPAVRGFLLVVGSLYFTARSLAGRALGAGGDPKRGMMRWTDLVDWLGGWPFEVARPEDVIERYRALGFTVERLRTVGGRLGCNEFLLRR